MPKRLLDRLRDDTIIEFRAAARERSMDAAALAAVGRRTAAIYLWGYAAEMTLKAAFFDVYGYATTQAIGIGGMKQALISVLGYNPKVNLHHLGVWADALVQYRATAPGRAYADPMFGSLIITKANAIYGLWRETIRYRKNTAYGHELSKVREAVEWLQTHSFDL